MTLFLLWGRDFRLKTLGLAISPPFSDCGGYIPATVKTTCAQAAKTKKLPLPVLCTDQRKLLYYEKFLQRKRLAFSMLFSLSGIIPSRQCVFKLNSIGLSFQ